MSSVMRPAGPLPARVYWVRRLLFVVVLAVTVSVVWWAFGRITGGAAESGGQSSTGDNTGATSDAGGRHSQGAPGHHGHGAPGHHGGKAGHGKHHRHRPARPTGDCAPSNVDIAVEVADVAAGHTAPIKLRLTSVGIAACTLAITPDTLALRVTSGPDVIWSSDECGNALLARQVVVRHHPATVYEFDWNGYRSTQTCRKPGKVADPGGYWAEAALIGGDVHRAYFDVT